MGRERPRMVSNVDVAEQFEEIADRLLLEGESWFKIAAYRRAATSLKALAVPVEAIAQRGDLETLPGVGDAISTKIEAYLSTGRIPLLDRLRAGQAPRLLVLLRETGLSPRQVRAIAAGPLAVTSPERLRQVLTDGSLKAAGALDAAGLHRVASWAARPDTPQSRSSQPA